VGELAERDLKVDSRSVQEFVASEQDRPDVARPSANGCGITGSTPRAWPAAPEPSMEASPWLRRSAPRCWTASPRCRIRVNAQSALSRPTDDLPELIKL
jgi:hypothetical protein